MSAATAAGAEFCRQRIDLSERQMRRYFRHIEADGAFGLFLLPGGRPRRFGASATGSGSPGTAHNRSGVLDRPT